MPTTTHSPHRSSPHGAQAAPQAAHASHEEHAAHGSAESHGVGHIVPLRILVNTALTLLALTIITVAVSWLDLGEFNIFIALGIAVIKGSLVCLFFMHLRWDRPFNSIVFVSSLVLVALFISFALTDTSEYQHEVIPGDAPKVKLKIDELVATPPPAEAAAPADPAKTKH